MAFEGEDPADGIVERHDLFDLIEEALQTLFGFQPVRSSQHPVVELSERNDTQSDTLGRQLIESLHNGLATVHIVNNPVRVYQVPHLL